MDIITWVGKYPDFKPSPCWYDTTIDYEGVFFKYLIGLRSEGIISLAKYTYYITLVADIMSHDYCWEILAEAWRELWTADCFFTTALTRGKLKWVK